MARKHYATSVHRWQMGRFYRAYLSAVLDDHYGRVACAARHAQVSTATFYKLCRQYGVHVTHDTGTHRQLIRAARILNLQRRCRARLEGPRQR